MRTTWRLLCVGMLVSSPAYAQDDEDSERGWSFAVLMGGERAPAYTGSDVYTNEAMFGAMATFDTGQGLSYSISTGGLGVEIVLPRDMELEVTLEYEPGRDNADDPILAGLATQEATWELQGVLTAGLGPFDLGVGLQHDILNRGKGTVGFIGIAYDFEVSERFSLAASADVSFANATHMNTEVGISAAEALATGLSAYDAPGGYKGLTLGLEAQYASTDTIALVGSVSFEQYGSAMSDSPLIRDFGSQTNTELALGVVFSF